MPFNFDTVNIILVIVGIINLVYGLVAFVRTKRSPANRWFFWVVVSVTFWIIGMIGYRGLQESELTVLWSRALYAAAAFIPLSLLYFSFLFPDDGKYSLARWQKYLMPIPALLIIVISLTPDFLIEGVNVLPGQEDEIIFNKSFHIIYALYIVGYFNWAYFNLIKKYWTSIGVINVQLRYIIIGTLIPSLIGVSTNLVLPLLGIFSLNWLGQVTISIMIASISYAILKHHLFNVRVIAAEFLTFVIWLFLLIRLLLEEDWQGRTIDGTLLVLAVLFGLFLIRGVIKEVGQRENLEKLTLKLEAANVRLRQLDEAKSEFLSIASHQLRTPLTTIKGMLSMVLEEFWGPLNDDQKKYISQAYQSGERLLKLIEDLLDISRIEAGRLEFNFLPLSMEQLVEPLVKSLTPQAAKKGLYLRFIKPKQSLPSVRADEDKIKQVAENLIDNSIKYTEQGGATIEFEQRNSQIFFLIRDTGLGIAKEQQSLLFKKFQRGQKAATQHTSGSGLGLYWAEKVILAHGGTIGIDSDGENKGSTFYFSLPIVAKN